MGSFHSAAHAHRGRLVVVLAITGSVFVAELIGALVSGSLGLLADAGHMFTDVAGIGMALGAVALAARPGSEARTYGLHRVEILAAVVNALLLFGLAAFIIVEAIRRLSDLPSVASGVMLTIAIAGLVANAVSLWMLRRAQGESLTMRGVYLEVLGDLLGSVAVIVAAVVIRTTGSTLADPIASLAIAAFIVPRTWHLLREAVDVLLEAAPRGVEVAAIRERMESLEGVLDVHDLHAWTITSGLPVVSAHVVVADGIDPADVLDRLCTRLSSDFDIEHSTFQIETEDRRRIENASHP